MDDTGDRTFTLDCPGSRFCAVNVLFRREIFLMNSELLYVFGTGNATVTNLYNTCFALRDGDEYFMVDAGGGNGILKILDNMQVPLERIHHIFVTHAHTDHVLGIVWMIRMIATKMKKDQ